MTIDVPSVYSAPARPEFERLPSPKRLSLWRHWRGLALLLALVVTFLAQLPMSYDFANFVFYDPGVSLRTDLLIAQGYVPTIDFGYIYGLLPLMIGRAF